MSQPFDVAELAASYASKSPQDILKLAFEHFGDELWISFSGAEDVVLVDMAWKLNKNVKVFSLDTGRLHPETYRFIEQVREHYGIAIEVLSPDPRLLEPFGARLLKVEGDRLEYQVNASPEQLRAQLALAGLQEAPPEAPAPAADPQAAAAPQVVPRDNVLRFRW